MPQARAAQRPQLLWDITRGAGEFRTSDWGQFICKIMTAMAYSHNQFRYCKTIVVLFCSLLGIASAQTTPLTVVPPPAYRGLVDIPVHIQLLVTGGRAPYLWKLQDARLPDGLRLDETSGVVFGTPTVSGQFRLPITVTDASAPKQQAQVELDLTLVAAVEVKWKRQPQTRGDGIFGSILVTNNTGRQLQFTVIVLAVNEINKAFALGYQHFDLKSSSDSPVIEFGSALPFGLYVVHVDAVAEDLAAKKIYRARLQTDRRLKLQQQ